MSDETKQLLAELVRQAVEPRWEQIKRIGLDGDVAMLEHEVTDRKALAFVARLRGRDTAPVFRITRSKARTYFNAQSSLNAFTTTRAPSGHTRILLWVRGVVMQVTHTAERGFYVAGGGQYDRMADLLRAPS